MEGGFTEAGFRGLVENTCNWGDAPGGAFSPPPPRGRPPVKIGFYVGVKLKITPSSPGDAHAAGAESPQERFTSIRRRRCAVLPWLKNDSGVATGAESPRERFTSRLYPQRKTVHLSFPDPSAGWRGRGRLSFGPLVGGKAPFTTSSVGTAAFLTSPNQPA